MISMRIMIYLVAAFMFVSFLPVSCAWGDANVGNDSGIDGDDDGGIEGSDAPQDGTAPDSGTADGAAEDADGGFDGGDEGSDGGDIAGDGDQISDGGDSSECDESICSCTPWGTCHCSYWAERTVTFLLNEICVSGLDPDECESAVLYAMSYWNAPTCSDMEVVYGGTTPRTDTWDSDTHLIIFRENEWNYSETNALNMINTSHGMDSGEISDADIEINCVYHECTRDHIRQVMIWSLMSALSVRDIDHLCRKYPTGEESPCKYLHNE